MEILIRNLRVQTKIGVHAWERERPQGVLINARILLDQPAEGINDRLENTLDYQRLAKRFREHLLQSDVMLLETLAEELTALALEEPYARSITLSIDKPNALTQADSVAVELTRHRS